MKHLKYGFLLALSFGVLCPPQVSAALTPINSNHATLVQTNAQSASSQPQEQTREQNLQADTIQLAARIIGLSKDELNRAFSTIVNFQIGKLTLPELDALSDQEVLAKIDFNTAPYANIDNERHQIIAKRYEIETQLLADHAEVELSKFQQFYRTFDRIVETGYQFNRYKIKLEQLEQGKTPENQVSTQGFKGPIIECDRSCQAINNQTYEDFQNFLGLLEDLLQWENMFGDQPLGTKARLIDYSTGAYVDVRRQLSALLWIPTGLTG